MRFLLVALSRLLLILAAFWLVRGLTRFITRSRSKPEKVTTQLKQDPICGTYVAEHSSLKIRSGHEELHFCSRQCQREYLRAHPESAA